MFIKAISFVLSLLVSIALLWDFSLNNFSVPNEAIWSVHKPTSNTDNIKVSLNLLQRTSTQLKFEIEVKNLGGGSAFIVTNPVRLDGTKGVYLSLNEDDPTLLELRLEVFPPPVYTRLAPKTKVTLKRLESDEIYKEEFILKTPFEETKPPYGRTPNKRPIQLSEVQHIIARLGVFPDESGVRGELVNDSCCTGLETTESGLFKGKPLFEIQKVISSEKIKL
jgi:hypothetical protein